MDPSDVDWERLDRYISGRGTPDELAALERWVDSDPELRTLADAMQTVGRPPGAAPEAWDARSAWRRVRRRMRLVGRPPLRVITADADETVHAGRTTAARPTTGPGETTTWGDRPPRRFAAPRTGVWRWLAAAAIIVVALGSTLMVFRSFGPPSDVPAVAVEMREVTTGRRQRSVLNLPDGSRVMVAPESRLRIPMTYTATRAPRDIYLEGQAHFEVEHDSTRPFRVYAANGVAEDLGTEFVVTAYPETHGMEVFVASGAVALRARQPDQSQGNVREDEVADRADAAAAVAARPLLTLTPGDLARLDSAGTATLTRGVDVAARLAWTHGSLVFDGTRLGEAIPVLERWYDIEIRLTDNSLADRRLTATFAGEPLPQVLELLALSLELEVEQNGESVTLTAQSRTRRSP